MSTIIGCIGLGIMGGPMAANLVAAGFDVVGFNRSPAKVERLVERGGRGATSVAEVARQADVVVTNLPDSPDVEAVVLGDDGVFAHLAPGGLLIDVSTIRPDLARRLAEEGTARGLHVLDAPVSGGEQGAIDATLSVMAGGTEEAFARARAVLDAVGSRVVHVGPAGAGQLVKAANQLIVGGVVGVLAEAMVFLDAYGVDRGLAVEVLGGGMARGAVFEQKAPKMLSRDFAPGFRVDLHDKDLRIVTAAAAAAGVAIPIGERAAELMAATHDSGRGDLDHSAVLLEVERRSHR